MRTLVVRRAVILGLVGLGLSLASIPLVRGGTPVSAASAVPYSDPDAVGSIGLCNQAGQQITSGNINTAPFAWRAVSSQPAPAPYNGASRTAQLLAYQPLMGLAASDWSGGQLTASSRYSNPGAPMAAATSADPSLAQYMIGYKPDWDGFLELRIYLGAANEQAYTVHYPALNIEVTGQTWQAVGGGPVDCAAGTAESIESILLPSTTTSTTTTTPPGASVAAGTGAAGAGGGSDTPGSPPTHAAQAQAQHAAADSPATHLGATPASSTSPGGSGVSPWVVVGTLLALAAVVLVLLLVRRRGRSEPPSDPDSRSPSHPEAPTTVGGSSTKGTSP